MPMPNLFSSRLLPRKHRLMYELLVTTDLTWPELAAKTGFSVNEVRKLVQSIFHRMGVFSREQLMIQYFREHKIEPLPVPHRATNKFTWKSRILCNELVNSADTIVQIMHRLDIYPSHRVNVHRWRMCKTIYNRYNVRNRYGLILWFYVYGKTPDQRHPGPEERENMVKQSQPSVSPRRDASSSQSSYHQHTHQHQLKR